MKFIGAGMMRLFQKNYLMMFKERLRKITSHYIEMTMILHLQAY
ncbi:MAG: hypothetical protein PHX18_01845 [Candidatus Gastranaerophilales bacterium]|nr:hypothetical protein [Candidatus Gastranaerophilales bacterium]